MAIAIRLTQVCSQAIPLFRDLNPPGHGGRILNITSVGGYIGNATLAYYCAGKFGGGSVVPSHPPPN